MLFESVMDKDMKLDAWVPSDGLHKKLLYSYPNAVHWWIDSR